ncbi:hypothetical protein HAX54_028249 [Datura stramonium]|uniref:Uncharacterized protein n=1 Tax=Datura stramonium TaxID=4076 RepID=A0ABS8V712_DATST|nr:hypothetical protein [Datura stramonium]
MVVTNRCGRSGDINDDGGSGGDSGYNYNNKAVTNRCGRSGGINDDGGSGGGSGYNYNNITEIKVTDLDLIVVKKRKYDKTGLREQVYEKMASHRHNSDMACATSRQEWPVEQRETQARVAHGATRRASMLARWAVRRTS